MGGQRGQAATQWQAVHPHRRMSSLSRRSLLSLALLATAWPLRARAGFNFFTSEYTASHAELQALIVKQFPLVQRYAEIFTVTLRDPQLGLNATANRASITAQLSIASPWLRAGTASGVVALSSALRYDPAARALQLDQPKAERLELQGVTGSNAERLQRIGGLVAQELLQGQALRTFTVEELTVGRKTYEIGDITVLEDGIKVQLL